MPQYPVNPEGPLFEALKETLTGNSDDGRYARRVLGEEISLDEAKAKMSDTMATLSDGIASLLNKLAQVAFKENGTRLIKPARDQIGRMMYAAAERELKKIVK